MYLHLISLIISLCHENYLPTYSGSSAGIGAASAVEFAKYGAKLVIAGRDPTKIDEVTKRCLESGASDVSHL